MTFCATFKYICPIVAGVLVLLLAKSCVVSGEMKLSIRMNHFLNPSGSLANKKCCYTDKNWPMRPVAHQCPVNKCTTLFHFCLNASPAPAYKAECISQYTTPILGAHSISREQFMLTTDSIELLASMSEREANGATTGLYLHVQARNDQRQLISTWSVDVLEKQQQQQQQQQASISATAWTQFNDINLELNQQLSFSYKISCANGYTGEHCQTPVCATGCDLTKGGHCQKANECLCKHGWYGPNCDQNTESDQNNTVGSSECNLECANGGVCEFNAIGERVCACDTNLYAGLLCQTRLLLDTCDENLCMNGASCLANGECLCSPGYAGDRCQTKRLSSQCGSVTCYNGGTCFINNQNEYMCACHPAFMGKFCDVHVNRLAAAPPTTTTTKTTTTTTTTTKTTSTSSATVSITVGIDSSEKTRGESRRSRMPGTVVAEVTQLLPVHASSRFSAQELALILVVGIGMPVLSVLVAVLFLRAKSSQLQQQVHAVTGKSKAVEANEYVTVCDGGDLKKTHAHEANKSVQPDTGKCDKTDDDGHNLKKATDMNVSVVVPLESDQCNTLRKSNEDNIYEECNECDPSQANLTKQYTSTQSANLFFITSSYYDTMASLV